jgi:hypothetical protein
MIGSIDEDTMQKVSDALMISQGIKWLRRGAKLL